MPVSSTAQDAIPSSPQEDALLVQEAQRDPVAFAALYRRYVTSVYRYLYSRSGNAADAEDLTAEVFVHALNSLRRYREQGHFAAWLFSIARRKAADHHRRSRPHMSLDEALDAPTGDGDLVTQVLHDESLRMLSAVVGRLAEEHRELLRLRFAAGLTYGQIGELTGRSEAAAKMALHRLLRRLEVDWEGAYGPKR